MMASPEQIERMMQLGLVDGRHYIVDESGDFREATAAEAVNINLELGASNGKDEG